MKAADKPEKVLKEILLSTEDSKPSSANANINNSDPDKSFASNGDLKDIPVPAYSNGISAVDSLIHGAFPPTMNQQQPPLPREPHPLTGRRNRKTDLPMPPGIDVPPDVHTPSPPKDYAGPSKKKGLLDMPMPPMIPGDFGNDENDGFGRRNIRSSSRGNGTSRSHRPKIINRRRSESSSGDWGERCVDVFQIIAQIGEGNRLQNFI